ncbi:hypothetical protein QAD02_010315 [Eretmocerus hayati]|uniref:Uncharacterized protein n=1 Tax=Eretmocerus hayati TaxID=131215 RepID=A0ACC2NEG4_9HYME|nr:hypothetical protein QAD02_010315 [Eretmocerus hayati]
MKRQITNGFQMDLDTSPGLGLSGTTTRARAALLATTTSGTGGLGTLGPDRRVVFLASQSSQGAETRTWPHHWSPTISFKGKTNSLMACIEKGSRRTIADNSENSSLDLDMPEIFHRVLYECSFISSIHPFKLRSLEFD